MKYYVYELWDIIKNQLFYVGKWCGKRTSVHTSSCYLAKQDSNQYKKNVIRKMLSENNKPVAKYVFRSEEKRNKMSQTNKGRKCSYRADGTWFFIYPEKA